MRPPVRDLLGSRRRRRLHSCRPTRSATASTTSPTRRRFSPTVLEGYLRAAGAISSLAVGDREGGADRSQSTRCPHGERRCASRGCAVRHARRHCGHPYLSGRRRVHVPHDAALDPDRAAVRQQRSAASRSRCRSTACARPCSTSTPRMSEADPNGMNLVTPRIYVKAGPQRVAAAFISALRRAGGRPDRADRAHDGRQPDRQRLRHHGAAAPARVRRHRPDRRSPGSPTRRAAAHLQLPADGAAEEAACATEIVKRLATLGLPRSGLGRRRPTG